MSLILAGTRAFGLLAGIGYDVIFQTMVKTGSRIVNTAYYLTEKPDYPRTVTNKVYELDLAAKIAIVNAYLQNIKSELKRSGPAKVCSLNDNLSDPDHIFETVDYLDSIISGDTALLNKLLNEKTATDPTIVNLLYLQQSLVRIDNILLYIKATFEQHKKRWFSSWRRLDLTKDLKQLELETKILENRVSFIAQLKLMPNNLKK